MRYLIVIHKDADSDYGVTVPDLPGCFSAGDTFDEAIAAATEAVECHIEGLLIDGEDIPQPSSMEVHQQNKDYADGIWGVVDVDVLKLSGTKKRINITVPERVLSKIDAHAKQSGQSRSRFLIESALDSIRENSVV
ncbi:MAG: type II toxin-antitoxin system HicB family antitoxin [Thermosynechococcaceae cyanobacterium]